MNIYVDFDDCLCETARAFSRLAAELFGKIVPYENIKYFDLQRSFSLEVNQYEQMMTEAHRPERLLASEETSGACAALNSWLDVGHTVTVITGRPCSAYGASRAWLDRHGLKRAGLYCLDKYGRDRSPKNSLFRLEITEFYKITFDYIVEDSPAAFRFFEHLPEATVMIFDRPWNRDCVFPGKNYCRCFDWETIRRLVTGPAQNMTSCRTAEL